MPEVEKKLWIPPTVEDQGLRLEAFRAAARACTGQPHEVLRYAKEYFDWLKPKED